MTRGPGRPPIPHPQDARLAVRMRAELLEAIEHAAELAGEETAEFVRRVLADAAAKGNGHV